MRRSRQIWFAIFTAVVPAGFAQIIPWTEPPAVWREEGKIEGRSRAPRSLVTTEEPRRAKATPAWSGETLALTQVEPLWPEALSILLSTFDGGAGAGRVLAHTSWEGNVTQNGHSITIGGTASDDNGWGMRTASIDASMMSFLSVTAQREAGNRAPALFVQLEDRSLRTRVFAVSTSLFAVGALTTVQIPLGAWTIDFGANEIVGWSIGGGSVGTVPFRLTVDELSFSAAAIPEPSTYGVVVALVGLGVAVGCRTRMRPGVRAEG